MAWEWSHTDNAYQSIEQQLQAMADLATVGDMDVANWLYVCWSEWVASDWRECNGSTDLDLRKYAIALTRAKRQAKELGFCKLADDIWNWSTELRTCTNGGWEAWLCPFGCHTLPFSSEVDSEHE